MNLKTRPYDELEAWLRNYLRPFPFTTEERHALYTAYLRIGVDEGYCIENGRLYLGPGTNHTTTKEHAQ